MRLSRTIVSVMSVMLHALVALFLCGAILVGETAAQSDVAEPEGIVETIKFPEIVSDKDLKEFSELVEQKVGQPLDRELVRQSIKKLYTTGRFVDIRAEVDATPNHGIALTFITVANYFIGRVTAEGNTTRPSANQITNASKLQLGTVFTRDKLDRALKNIAQLMSENGYYRSTTEVQETRKPETQQTEILLRVTPGPQARVGKVLVNGDTTHTAEEIQNWAKLHPGNLVTVQRTSNALDRLRKRYQKQSRWLAQVSISQKLYQPATDTVDYTFTISRGPKVNVTVEGFKLSRGVIKRNVPVFEESAADDDLLNEGRRNLLNHLQSMGYYEAQVTLKKENNAAGNELNVIYTIDSGARHKLVKLEIKGNKYFSDEILRARMQVQPADRLVYPHGRFSQSLLSGDVSRVRDLYRASGFEQIKVTSTVEDDYQGENQLGITINIEEGSQTLVSDFEIKGNEKLKQSDFPLLNASPGQPYSEVNISSDRELLLNYYFSRGFPDASFEATSQPTAEPNRVKIVYLIHEGDQVFVDQVLVTGLVHTRPFIVKRELQIEAGDPMDQIALLKTQQKLYDLGIFSQVDTAVQNPEGSERSKNVLISTQEAKRYTFNYGLGFEFQTGQPTVGTNQPLGQTGVSPLVSLEVTRLNFRGVDHTVAFKANVGRLQQRGLVSYEAPRWFNSPAWRLTLTAFYDNTVDVTTYTSQRLEGLIQAQQKINKASTMTYRFAYRRVKASEIEISQELIPLLSQPTNVGGPGFAYLRNKRDNDLDSTKGSYFTLDGSVASGAFASQSDFSRVLTQFSTYHSFGPKNSSNKRLVFAHSIRVGVENSFSGTAILQPYQTCPDLAQTSCPGLTLIPLAERFLAGGGNSLRGFGLNQAGPRDPQTGYPLGGSGLFINNVELRFPPRTLPYVQDNLSFALFEDAGNVFSDGRTMLDNLLRWRQKNVAQCLEPPAQPPPATSPSSQCDYSYVSHAVGIGVRYKTPVGPVSLDFGYNLNPPAFPSCQATAVSAFPGASSYCSSDAATPYFVPQRASHFNVFFSIGQSF